MPRKITSPIREGLSAKIYLACYSEPKTVYRLAQGWKVRSSSIAREVNERFPELFEKEKKTEKGRKKKLIRSKVGPLLQEIEGELGKASKVGGNDLKLTVNEREKLKEYLNGPFRESLSPKYIEFDYSRGIDAFSEILSRLKCVFTAVFMPKVINAIQKRLGVSEPISETYRRLLHLDSSTIKSAFESSIFNPVKGFSDRLFWKLDAVPTFGLVRMRAYAWGYKEFMKSSTDAYRMGFEKGYIKGYREGFRGESSGIPGIARKEEKREESPKGENKDREGEKARGRI